jgi:hypothetical protein
MFVYSIKLNNIISLRKIKIHVVVNHVCACACVTVCDQFTKEEMSDLISDQFIK